MQCRSLPITAQPGKDAILFHAGRKLKSKMMPTYLSQPLVDRTKSLGMPTAWLFAAQDLLTSLNPSGRCSCAEIDLVRLETACGRIEDNSIISLVDRTSSCSEFHTSAMSPYALHFRQPDLIADQCFRGCSGLPR